MRQLRTIVTGLAVFWAAEAYALPDLTPEIFDVSIDENATVNPDDVIEGCAGAATGRRLLRFSLRTRNLGPDDLVMGNPACPDCSTNPGVVCGNPLYECSTAHGHPHFEGFAGAELLDGMGQVVATGHKQGFCLLDLECPTPQFSCGYQGISAGCSDIYATGLPCQYIDLTGATVPDGSYTLRVTLDEANAIAEADEANNQVTTPISIGDPGPPPAPTCPVFTASDLPQSIQDFTTTTSVVNVTRPGDVTRLRVVNLEGTHTYIGDLVVTLRDPGGTTVTLLDNDCSEANFDLDLAAAPYATDSIPCPATGGGLYRVDALSAFTGPSLGTWTLSVEDQVDEDVGTLVRWGLEVCTACGNGTLDAGEACDDGNANDGDCCSSDCQTVVPDGSACVDAAQCVVGGTCQAGACTSGTVSCDPCLTCDPPNGCVPPTHVLCETAPPRDSRVMLTRHPTSAANDRLSWTWTSSLPVALLDFGNPSAATDLTLCVFDQSGLKLSATAPAGGTCGDRPCWASTDAQLKYAGRDLTPDGLLRIIATAGEAGEARISVKGKGANLGLPALPLSGPVTVRLTRSGGPACWQARFPTSQRNRGSQYQAKVAN